MNTLPGFTGDATLYLDETRYRTISTGPRSLARIEPQLRKIFPFRSGCYYCVGVEDDALGLSYVDHCTLAYCGGTAAAGQAPPF